MTVGSGNDTFVFQSFSNKGATLSNADVITDFTQGSDHIDISGLRGATAFNFIGTHFFDHMGAGAPEVREVLLGRQHHRLGRHQRRREGGLQRRPPRSPPSRCGDFIL